MLETTCACTKLRRAARALTRMYDAALEPAGLTSTQFALLRMCQRLGEGHISALAEATGIERSSVGRNLRPLLSKGWLETTQGADLRTRVVKLTPAGEQLIAQALPLWETVQSNVTKRLGTENRAVLFALAGVIEQWD